MSNNFSSIKGLDLNQVKQDISFPVSRVDLVKENPHGETQYQMLQRDDVNRDLGIIKDNHTIVPYSDVTDWMTNEFDDAGLVYKLKDSVIKRNGDLFQEYLFDYDINSPDGSDMSPLVIVKSSYLGNPLDAFFGTYRFVCSNGVMVGETIKKIHVSSKSFDLITSSIKSDIKDALQKFDKVANLYKDLSNQDFDPYLNALIVDAYLSTGCKKVVLQELQDAGDVELLKDKIKAQDFTESWEGKLLNIIDGITAWEFYNIVTNVVTRKSRSVNARLGNYSSVSRVFGI